MLKLTEHRGYNIVFIDENTECINIKYMYKLAQVLLLIHICELRSEYFTRSFSVCNPV
jgi:hypothetical protein